MEKRQQYIREIDLGDFFSVLLRRSWWIVLAGILAGAAMVLLTRFCVTPEYTSTTKMYVLAKQDSSTLTTGDMQTSTMLTKDYTEIVRTRTVIEDTISEMQLNMTYEEFNSRVAVHVPEDTRMIYISVTDEDPKRAAQTADVLREKAAQHIQQVMATEAVNVADKANIPTAPSSPNVKKNGLIAGAAGAAAVFLLILIQYVMNDTVKTSDEIEKYLNISTLGILPMEAEARGKGGRRMRRGAL